MSAQLPACLIDALNGAGITYCHWKSNINLPAALEEGDELDLLVEREDARRFEDVLAALGFKQATDSLQAPAPAILHFYGLDRATDRLVHLHVYYRVITGESLLKNYSLPLEAPLLHCTRTVAGIPIPQAHVELVVFVIRAMAKHASALEYMLLRGADRSGVAALRVELAALLAETPAERAAEVLEQWLPSVDRALFAQCVDALRADAPYPRRLRLARRLRGQLKTYQRYSAAAALRLRTSLFARRGLRRLIGAAKSKRLVSGGLLIAFVGPEATGKSTLVKETADWLGDIFAVRTAHLGKPPSTWLTFAPNLVLPLVRKAAPQQRMSRRQQGAERDDEGTVSLLYALRAVLLAWDRRALAAKLRRAAADGTLVVCDRYPSATVGAMDSARLKTPGSGGIGKRLLGYLARLEGQIYRQIQPPDLVIRLTVPVEIAIERNRERIKKGKEADAYVLQRHTSGVVPAFPLARTIDLDSNQPRSRTISAARHIVWDAL